LRSDPGRLADVGSSVALTARGRARLAVIATGTCSARCDRDAPNASHTLAVRRTPAAKSGEQKRSRRTSGPAQLAQAGRHAVLNRFNQIEITWETVAYYYISLGTTSTINLMLVKALGESLS
jgi:hypothetical protein